MENKTRQCLFDLGFKLYNPGRFVQMNIIRVKYFEMPPLTLDQALKMLSNVGHDFYVFRDIKSGMLN